MTGIFRAEMEGEDDTPIVTVKYHIGDLINGHLKSFDIYEDAYREYVKMAESCASTDRGGEDPDISREEAIAESLALRYVCKVTTTKCGSVTSEDKEFIDGGTEDFTDTF